MRTVVPTEEGVLELNYLWLPTWIGINSILKKQIEDELGEKIVGLEMTDDTLNQIDEMVVDFLVEQNPHIEGLKDFLDGLKFVHFKMTDGGT